MIKLYGIKSIQVEVSNGHDRYNAPLPPIIKSVDGFVEFKSELTKNKKGLDVVSNTVVRIEYDELLSNADFVILNGKKHKVANIETPQSFTEKYTLIRLEPGE